MSKNSWYCVLVWKYLCKRIGNDEKISLVSYKVGSMLKVPNPTHYKEVLVFNHAVSTAVPDA